MPKGNLTINFLCLPCPALPKSAIALFIKQVLFFRDLLVSALQTMVFESRFFKKKKWFPWLLFCEHSLDKNSWQWCLITSFKCFFSLPPLPTSLSLCAPPTPDSITLVKTQLRFSSSSLELLLFINPSSGGSLCAPQHKEIVKQYHDMGDLSKKAPQN